MTGSPRNLDESHRSPPLGALAIVFTALFLGSMAPQAIMTGSVPFPIPYNRVSEIQVRIPVNWSTDSGGSGPASEMLAQI